MEACQRLQRVYDLAPFFGMSWIAQEKGVSECYAKVPGARPVVPAKYKTEGLDIKDLPRAARGGTMAFLSATGPDGSPARWALSLFIIVINTLLSGFFRFLMTNRNASTMFAWHPILIAF